jgi:hypothetical protein
MKEHTTVVSSSRNRSGNGESREGRSNVSTVGDRRGPGDVSSFQRGQMQFLRGDGMVKGSRGYRSGFA